MALAGERSEPILASAGETIKAALPGRQSLSSTMFFAELRVQQFLNLHIVDVGIEIGWPREKLIVDIRVAACGPDDHVPAKRLAWSDILAAIGSAEPEPAPGATIEKLAIEASRDLFW
jgi:hypothetical protein